MGGRCTILDREWRAYVIDQPPSAAFFVNARMLGLRMTLRKGMPHFSGVANAPEQSSKRDTNLLCLRSKSRAALRKSTSAAIARNQDKDHKSDDDAGGNQHPILYFQPQNNEIPRQKSHRSIPFFGQTKRFGTRRILFLYLDRKTAREGRMR